MQNLQRMRHSRTGTIILQQEFTKRQWHLILVMQPCFQIGAYAGFASGDAKNALNDAQACSMMRPGWPKASYREGTALMLLKDYEKACDAFLDGLKLELGNVELEDGLRQALESLKIYCSSPGQD